VAVVAGETLPHVGEHGIPFCLSVQLTLGVAEGSFMTVAVNVVELPAFTVAVVGATETVIAGTVTVEEPDFDVSATEAAVTVTVRLLAGALAGAV